MRRGPAACASKWSPTASTCGIPLLPPRRRPGEVDELLVRQTRSTGKNADENLVKSAPKVVSRGR
eukprot:16356807-Heterocapsa_arctica.AAC.1